MSNPTAIDSRTIIEAVPGLRASAEIIPNYGTCSVSMLAVYLEFYSNLL